jgi:hypothetical protein
VSPPLRTRHLAGKAVALLPQSKGLADIYM